jgi:hypothetical protein
MIAMPTGVRRNLRVVLICISFMDKDAHHFFMYLLPVCTSSFENCLFNSFAYLFSRLINGLRKNVVDIHNGILFTHKEE